MPNILDINTLETWIWEAVCKIRGEHTTQIPYETIEGQVLFLEYELNLWTHPIFPIFHLYIF
ncbi:MAG: hypothetical protein A2Y97_01800 [Nitrospirae bacterium RBG_13_39_12]|nr:MAG: hypothetical protein A2Y97_01800 [Nitrospirae bacterium RBG_13_39_12]